MRWKSAKPMCRFHFKYFYEHKFQISISSHRKRVQKYKNFCGLWQVFWRKKYSAHGMLLSKYHLKFFEMNFTTSKKAIRSIFKKHLNIQNELYVGSILNKKLDCKLRWKLIKMKNSSPHTSFRAFTRVGLLTSIRSRFCCFILRRTVLTVLN